jgi:RNA polymerase sigma-70 factor, ECF subfamily
MITLPGALEENNLVRIKPMTPEQFTSHYREYLPAISKYLLRRVDRSDVEDLASAIFEIAWAKKSQAKEGFELAWLYKIAGFVVSNHRRKQKTAASLIQQLMREDSSPSAEEIAIVDVSLAEAWKKLTSAERQVIALTAFESLTVPEAALALEISNNALSIRLSRARAKLARILSEDS